MTVEENHIMLMDTAYQAADKETYYKYMQKADEVLKSQKIVDECPDSQMAALIP